MTEGAFERGPGREAGENGVGIVAGQGRQNGSGFEAVEETGLGQPQKGGKWFLTGGELAVAAEEERYRVGLVAGGMFEGDQAGFGREPIDELVAGERLHMEKYMKLRKARKARKGMRDQAAREAENQKRKRECKRSRKPGMSRNTGEENGAGSCGNVDLTRAGW
ncbi:MAG TPA: hypothetical protein PKU89_02495 [Kiritimatiellia bacterium]|nr:hypothetical protein [Kiritimatiellia bacterium]